MARKVQVDMKAGQLNREGKGQGGYKKVGHNEASTGQVKSVGLGKHLPKNFRVHAMTGPSTQRDHAPQLPKGK